MVVGERYPDIAAEIYLVAGHPNSAWAGALVRRDRNADTAPW